MQVKGTQVTLLLLVLGFLSAYLCAQLVHKTSTEMALLLPYNSKSKYIALWHLKQKPCIQLRIN